jgi:hypothetical protein
LHFRATRRLAIQILGTGEVRDLAKDEHEEQAHDHEDQTK